MAKKLNINENERDQFRAAIKGTQPIKRSRAIHPTPSPKIKLRSQSTSTPLEMNKKQASDYLDTLNEDDWVSGEDKLQFARTGVQERIRRKLARGDCTLEASLDLHGLLADQALTYIDEFLATCQQNGKRWVLIVHGKGKLSVTPNPRLKNLLNQKLREHPGVLAFHSAKPKHGGSGALYVLLKSNRGENT